MCIAIYKPKGKVVTKTALNRSFVTNSDGCGYVFAHKGRLIIKKGFFKFKDFWHSFRADMAEYGNPTTLIHFRIATHGRVDADNCHPFAVGKNFAFIHNGVIDCVMLDKDMSDTHNFGKYVLTPLVREFGKKLFESHAMGDLIGMAIGYSKLAIIDNNGEVVLVNSDMGVWEHGVWYSNESYKPKTTSRTYYRGRGGAWSLDDDDFDWSNYDREDGDIEEVRVSDDNKKSAPYYDDAMTITRRYKANANEDVEPLDLSSLKGMSLSDVVEMDEDDFFNQIRPSKSSEDEVE